MTMVSALLLLVASAAPQAGAAPVRLECSFTGEDPSSEQTGPRRIAFAIGARGSRVESVAVDDPTGLFSSGNIVGFISAGRSGGRYAAAPGDEDSRWRGRMDGGRITLTGTRREVLLTADPQNPGAWSGSLRYELGGAGSVRFAKEGTLSCRPAPAGNSQ